MGGTYVLRSVEGEPLPTQLYPPSNAYRPDVVADTLRLDVTGHGTLTRVVSLRNPSTGVETVARWEMPVSYRYDEWALRGEVLCPPNADCVLSSAEFTGTLRRGGLRIESGLAVRVPLEYERVSR